MNLRAWHLVSLAVLAAPAAQAREARIDVPGGRLEDAAMAVARQTGSSVVIADRVLAMRPVRGLSGNYSARAALERLARAAGARLVSAGPNAWRLEPGRAAMAAAPRPRPAPVRREPPAQPPPTIDAQEIVVTASKRDSRLADFAGQVSLLDGAALSFGGVGGTEKIAQRLASLTTTHLGSGRNKLFIRGIADSSFTGPTQATVGQYLGDLRLSYNAPDPDLRLVDLASVEVLEGPQGTLYGAGSLGGIVRLVPNAANLTRVEASMMGGASMTLHGRPGLDVSAVVNLPLVEDRLGLRLSGSTELDGGYIDKPVLGAKDVNRTRLASGRASLRYALAPNWSVELTGIGQTTKGDDSQYADRPGPPYTSSAQVIEGYSADYLQGQLVVAGQLGQVHLRSTTGIARQVLRERYDATGPGDEPRVFVQSNHTRMIANETRVWVPLEDSFGWVLGASYIGNTTRLGRALGPVLDPRNTTGVENRIEEFTLFGEASLRLAPRLTASAGGRFTSTRLSGQGENFTRAIGLADLAITNERNERRFLPSAALVFQPLDKTSMYWRYQQGFRPGGLTVDNDFVRQFQGDRVYSYEFGLRHGRPGRGRFDLSASVSYTDWRNIQADFIDPTGLPSTANVGDGKIWTLSLSGGYSPAPDLRIDWGIVYNNSRITQPNLYMLLVTASVAAADVGYATSLPGSLDPNYLKALADQRSPITEIPNVADLAASLGVDYRHRLTDRLELTTRGWLRYVGKSRLGVGPELGSLQGDYLDSGLTLRLGNDTWGASLGATNLFDVHGNRFSLGTPFVVGREQVTPLRPLTLRLGFDAKF